MSSTVWSYATFVASALGLWISGNNPKLGWKYAIVIQFAVWAPEAWFTRRWGDAALAAVFVFLYSRNLWRWRNTSMPSPGKQAETEPAA